MVANGHAQAVEIALKGREIELVALLDVLGQRGELHLVLRVLDVEAAALVVRFGELVAQHAQAVGEFLDGRRHPGALFEQRGQGAFAFADLPAQAFEIRFDLRVLREHRLRALLVIDDVLFARGDQLGQLGEPRFHGLALVME